MDPIWKNLKIIDNYKNKFQPKPLLGMIKFPRVKTAVDCEIEHMAPPADHELKTFEEKSAANSRILAASRAQITSWFDPIWVTPVIG